MGYLMRAGSLRHVITIKRKAGETVSASGAAVPAWTDFATVRAEIAKASATEFLTGYGEAESNTVIFRIRKLAGITTADRIVHDGIAYDLKDIVPVEYGRGLELRAVTTR